MKNFIKFAAVGLAGYFMLASVSYLFIILLDFMKWSIKLLKLLQKYLLMIPIRKILKRSPSKDSFFLI